MAWTDHFLGDLVDFVSIPVGNTLGAAFSKVKEVFGQMHNDGNTDGTNEYKSYLQDLGFLMYKSISLSNVGIQGIPYQFNVDADVPLSLVVGDSTSNNARYIGRTYEEKILGNCPIVFFQLGKPDFLGGKDNGVGSILLNALIEGTEDLLGSEGDSVVEFTGNEVNKLQYYTFKDAFDEYASYVNTMARFVAIKMGIGDRLCASQRGNDTYAAFDIKQIRNRLFPNTEVENKRTELKGKKAQNTQEITIALSSINGKSRENETFAQLYSMYHDVGLDLMENSGYDYNSVIQADDCALSPYL